MQTGDDIVVKEEDDQDPPALEGAPVAARLPSGGRVTWFPPGAALLWTASTASQLQGVVDRREEVFAELREAYTEIGLQEQSEDLIADLVTSQRTRHLEISYEAWVRFCLLANVPPFPVTWPALGLCVFSHCSSVKGCPRNFVNDVKLLRRATERLWTTFDYVSVLDSLDPAGQACASFVAERRTVPSEHARAPSRATSSTARLSDTDSESGDERDEKTGNVAAGSCSAPTSIDSHRLVRVCRSAPRDFGIDALRLAQKCPGFPQPHQQFATPEALYTAFLKAVFPVYGVTLRQTWTAQDHVHYRCSRYGSGAPSSRCQYFLVGRCDSDTSLWSFDESASTLEHGHGPDSRILVDPTWRPTVNNPVIVRALELEVSSRTKARASKRRRTSAPSSKLSRKSDTKATFSTPHAPRRRRSPSDRSSSELEQTTSSRRSTAGVATASGSGTSGSRFASSSSRAAPFLRPVIPSRPTSSIKAATRTSVFAPIASTSAAAHSRAARTRPDARTPPAPLRALVSADALVGSYLLELEPSGSLQVLVSLFVARGFTTWRTLSELKDPATARRLCADILPAASGEVVEALLRFVQLVAR
ncbi:hypothetical protein JCM9279_007485 [Rhodotorula babjevae]